MTAAYPLSRIIVQSILPSLTDFISNDAILKANERIMQLSVDCGIEFLDIYWHLVDRKKRPIKEYYRDDGVHLNKKGYAVWISLLESVLCDKKSQLIQDQGETC
jgi:lysophospholipase L1-like esterase